jgi:hypothetical protein
MKFLAFIALIFFAPLMVSPKSVVTIDSGAEVQLRFSSSESTEVQLNTPSNAGVTVRVERVSDRSFVRGFGMSKGSKEKVLVDSDAVLILKNENNAAVEITYESNQSVQKRDPEKNGVSLTFHNGSLASIPLIIPGVMNPNLIPMSDSGVTLGYGQKVFFKEKGKQYLLFEIDETFKDGDKLEIQDLIKVRKKQLGS